MKSCLRQLHKEYQNIFLDIVGQLDENYTDVLRQAEAEGFCKYHGLQINMFPFTKMPIAWYYLSIYGYQYDRGHYQSCIQR